MSPEITVREDASVCDPPGTCSSPAPLPRRGWSAVMSAVCIATLPPSPASLPNHPPTPHPLPAEIYHSPVRPRRDISILQTPLPLRRSRDRAAGQWAEAPQPQFTGQRGQGEREGEKATGTKRMRKRKRKREATCNHDILIQFT